MELSKWKTEMAIVSVEFWKNQTSPSYSFTEDSWGQAEIYLC